VSDSQDKSAACPFGFKLEPYWARRYSLFTRFDEGIKIDADGLYSVKPEAVALEIAKRIEGERVLDAFGGVGGSAIGFARAGKQVVCVEIDEQRIGYARHNAKLYGVANRITFVHGDVLELMGRLPCDAIYLDPPWGGP